MGEAGVGGGFARTSKGIRFKGVDRPRVEKRSKRLRSWTKVILKKVVEFLLPVVVVRERLVGIDRRKRGSDAREGESRLCG
jgi:hypothetical protein